MLQLIAAYSSFGKGNISKGCNTKCSSARKNFQFCPILAKVYERSGNFKGSKGIKNTHAKGTSPRKIWLNTPLKKSEILSEKKRSNKCWRREQQSKSLRFSKFSRFSKSTSEQSLSCKEERSGWLSRDKPESSKSVCAWCTLQNGKFADLKILVEGKSIHVQN